MQIEDGIRIILKDWLDVKDGEIIHFVSDDKHIKEAEIFKEVLEEFNVIGKISILDSQEVQKGNIIEEIREELASADAIIGATHYSFITTDAVNYALKNGSRFLSFPLHSKVDKSIFEQDFIKMNPGTAKEKALKIKEKFDNGSIVRITTKKGTDIEFDISGRTAGTFTGECKESGIIASSCFETYIPIIENKTTGIMICDASLGYLGKVKEDIKLEYKDGYLINIEDNATGRILKEYIRNFDDEEMYCAVELGIGLNELGYPGGNCYIEDESAYKTFHIGMGRNIALGGIHEAKGHFDLVGHEPDVYVDGSMIMENGKLII